MKFFTKLALSVLLSVAFFNLGFSQPVITSFSPLSQNTNLPVTITGTGFNTTTFNNVVFFGATRATVAAATATQLTVIVPSGATYAPITVLNTGTGLAGSSLSNFTPTYRPTKPAITANDFLPKQDLVLDQFATPFAVAISDLDGDGKPDLVVANQNYNTISIYRNTSAIGFMSYAPKVDCVTGNGPSAITIGDIDGDGKPDLVVANANDAFISIFHNTAISGSITSGSFAKVDLPVFAAANSVALGDFDGDGKPDLVTSSGFVTLFRNTATVGSITTGSFAAGVIFVSQDSRSLAIGDIDGDGKPDLVTANGYYGIISIFRNTTTIGVINARSFATKVDIASGSYPYFVVVGDLNADGKPDIAVANNNSNNISIFRNTATTGTIDATSFAAKIDIASGTSPFSLAIGDVDGDGMPDLGVANSVSNTVSILRNTSTGSTISLAAKVDLAAGTGPQSLAIGDLDGDGKPDIATANAYSFNISVIQNATIGILFAPTSANPGEKVTISGSGFNTTTTNNIVFFGATRATVTASTATSLSVTVPVGATYAPISVLNTATGFAGLSLNNFIPIYRPVKGILTSTDFLPKQAFATKSGYVSYLSTISDLDGDGKPDLAVLTQNSITSTTVLSIYRNTSTTGAIATNSFATKVDVVTDPNANSITIGDIDGDGKPDLVIANGGSNTVSVFRNTAISGTIDANSFAAKVDFVTGTTGNTNALGVAIGDLDGDGKLDLAVANGAFVSLYRNTATVGTIDANSFATQVDFATGNFGTNSIVIADLDGDAQPDIAVTNSYLNTISIYRNTATSGSITNSSFAAKVDFTTGALPQSLAIGDLDGDGRPDLAVVYSFINNLSIFRNTGASGYITSSSFAAKVDFTTGANPSTIAIGDLNGDGKPDLVVSNSASDNTSIFQNTATSGSITTASFSAKVDLATVGTYGVAIGDLDGDGKPDLVVTGVNTVDVLRNADLVVPMITSFAPTTAKPGDAVTLTGTGFNTIANNNTVFFGATKATVNAASATSVTVTVPSGATYAPITLLNAANNSNCIGASKANFTPKYYPNKTVFTSNDFSPKQDFDNLTGGSSVAIGDLDGDGKPDLVIGANGRINVYRNISTNGSITSGSFAAKVNFAYRGPSNYPISLAIGDLDGDGKPDLVVGWNDTTLSVLRNMSIIGNINTNSFAPRVDFTVGAIVKSIAMGDLDGDGKPDLVTSSSRSNTISLLRNATVIGDINSNSFLPKVDFVTSATPTALAITDIDGDGKPDLIALVNGASAFSIFRNTATKGFINMGSLAASVDFGSNNGSTALAIGDLDGDGKPDVAITASNNAVSVFRNTSTSGIIDAGSFATNVDFATGQAPQSVAIGDLDGDGKPDLVTANFYQNSVSVHINTASSGSITNASFASEVHFTTGPHPSILAVGDLDSDGRPDLVVLDGGPTLFSVFRNADIPTTITSFTPITAKPGDVVTITGTGFNTTASNNIVFFGATQATVTAATFYSLTVTVPTGATYAPITMVNTATNLAASSINNFTPIYSPAKTAIKATDFLPKQDFAADAGANPFSIAIGDLDGDGKPDLAVANINTNTVSIYRNTSTSGTIGSSSYAAKVDFVTGLYPYAVAIGDVDGDGKPDLVVTNTGQYSVSILRNTATVGSITSGSFAATVDFPTGVTATSVALRDFDGDGKPDLAVANYGSGTVSIYHNTATVGSITTGSFAAKVDFTTNPQSHSLAIGDIDGDGKPDLVTANAGSNNISILRNTTTFGVIDASSFAAKVDIATVGNPWSVAIGDLNGDGKPDVAVVNSNGNNVSIFRNTATVGTIDANSFAPKIDVATGTTPTSLAIGDIDGDGIPDIAVANSNSNTVSVFRNSSTGNTISLAAKVDLATGTEPQSVAIGDLDGDGKPDIAIANKTSNTVSVFRNADIPVVITSFSPITAKSGDVVTITGVGFNTVTSNNVVFFGATRATVTAASATSATVTVPVGATYAPITLLNMPTSLAAYSLSNFTPIYSPAKTTITASDLVPKQDFATNVRPYTVVMGDLDGDGKPDLVVANVGNFAGSEHSVSVYRNTSTNGSLTSGSFAPKLDFATGSTPFSIAIGDLDGDGKPDLAVANYGSNTFSILRNTSTAGVIDASSFAPKIDFVTGASPSAITIGDIDADGKLDIAVVNNGSNTVSIFRNAATSGTIDANSMAAKVDFATGSSPNAAAFGDLDGDGKLDLAVASTNNNAVSLYRNTSTSGTIDVNSFAAKVNFTTGGQPVSIAIGDLDGDGKPDLVLACPKTNVLSVLRNTATVGSITTASFAAKQDFATGRTPESVAIGDIDGDGKPDLVTATRDDNKISLYRNTATSGTIDVTSFAAKIDASTGTDPVFAAIGDLDGDGKPDIAVTNLSSNTVSVYRNADIVTTWDGNTWSNGLPTASVVAIIASSTAPASFTCKALTINSGVTLTTTGMTATVYGNITNNGNGLAGTGTLNIAANSSISGSNLAVTGVLTVGSGATLTTNGLLTLKSTSITNTATVGSSAGAISGNVTVERYIPAGKRGFRFLTAPVTTTNFIKGNWQEGATSSTSNPTPGYGTHITGTTVDQTNGFDATATGNPSMFQFNNATQVWNTGIANTNATNLIAGNAYRLLVRGDRAFDLSTTSTTNTATTLRATGSLITGAVSFGSGSSSPSSLPTLAANANEYSFIGNPYASPIDWNGLTKTGLTGYYYIWDPTIGTRGAYVACFTDGTKSNSSSAVTTAIQSGQAFFVQNTSGASTRQLDILETNKTTGNTTTTVFGTTTSTATMSIQLYLTANIATGTSQDGTNVLFNSNYSNAVNDNDAGKFTNQDENIAIQRGNSVMSIERRNLPATPNDTVLLKTWQLTQNKYTLRIVSSHFDAGLTAYLRDNYLNIEIPLNLAGTTDIGFTTTVIAASTASDRFRIVFHAPIVLPVSITNLTAYQKNSGVQVEWHTANELNIAAYEVEKSVDGSIFTKAGTVTATGASSYNWFDAAPVNGSNYYRIKLVDKTETFRYTQVVNVKMGGTNNSFTVVGNPIRNKTIILQLENVEKGSYTVTVFNNLGQTIATSTINHAGGSATETIALGNVAAGIYQLRIIGNNVKDNRAIIVE